MAVIYFAHPTGNGYVQRAGGSKGFLLTLLFGGLYLAIKQAFAVAVLFMICQAILLLAAVAVAGTPDRPSDGIAAILIFMVGNIVLAWRFYQAPADAYRKRGWREVENAKES